MAETRGEHEASCAVEERSSGAASPLPPTTLETPGEHEVSCEVEERSSGAASPLSAPKLSPRPPHACAVGSGQWSVHGHAASITTEASQTVIRPHSPPRTDHDPPVLGITSLSLARTPSLWHAPMAERYGWPSHPGDGMPPPHSEAAEATAANEAFQPATTEAIHPKGRSLAQPPHDPPLSSTETRSQKAVNHARAARRERERGAALRNSYVQGSSVAVARALAVEKRLFHICAVTRQQVAARLAAEEARKNRLDAEAARRWERTKQEIAELEAARANMKIKAPTW